MAGANKPTPQDVVSDEFNYEQWASIAKATLTEKGLWDVVDNGVPPNPSKIPELAATLQAQDLSKWREIVINDMKALQILQCSLPDFVFKMTLETASAKDLWELLKEANEGAELEKNLDQLRLEAWERSYSSYLARVAKIANDPSLCDIDTKMTKVMISLSDSYDIGEAAPVIEQQVRDMQKLTFNSLRRLLDIFESMRAFKVESDDNDEAIAQLLNKMRDRSGDPKRRGFGNLHDIIEMFESSSVESIIGRLSTTRTTQVHKYQMLAPEVGPVTFDDDMWMLYNTTTNHMTPHEKYFTTLDRTHIGRITLIDGRTIMSQGMGDVVVKADKGKKMTIKNVLFVPELDRNVLSADQLKEQGYGDAMTTHKRTLKDKSGRYFGEATCDHRGYSLRLKVMSKKS